MKVKTKTDKPKLIDQLYKALELCSCEVEREGWHETIPKPDDCEWINITMYDKHRNKYMVVFYFTNDSCTLSDVTLYKAEIIDKPQYKDFNTIAK